MHSFAYKNGSLYCEDVRLADIAAAVGTPTFVYSKKTITEDLAEFREALSPLDAHVAYAVKACSNKAILNLMVQQGVGFDIVSGGELWRVINAGGDATLCTYAGVGKTEAEIRYALEQNIYCFNCESENELRAINRIAGEMGVKAPVAVRVNPHVDAHTHKYITTGTNENKFGVDITRIEELYATIAAEMPHLRIRGLQMHIGSQLTEIKPFVEAIEKVAPIVRKFIDRYGIEFWSIGGGIGIVYDGCLASGSLRVLPSHRYLPSIVNVTHNLSFLDFAFVKIYISVKCLLLRDMLGFGLTACFDFHIAELLYNHFHAIFHHHLPPSQNRNSRESGAALPAM